MNEKNAGHRRALELSLVIPIFNEEERISNSVARILPYLESNTADYEIIFVDDGSTDGSSRVIYEFRNHHFKLIRNERNFGKGYSVRRGMLQAGFPLVLFSDADFSTPIDDLDRLLPYLEGYDIVIGSRGMRESQISAHQPFYKE